ncbi:MAG TPA: FMN-binding protein [Frankiaceae bacterium]|nr:FMN-binding protein [Frankiaceae bacterium]
MRRAVFAILSTIAGLVLLLTFKTQNPTTPALTAPPAAISPSTSTSTGSSSSGSSGSSGSSSSGTKTLTGTAADTRYGPVQVQITVSNGKVTAATSPQYPSNDPRDDEINSYAIPELNQEATAAQSAQIDTISGATYTSEGYITSLQSALDQAGLS